MQGMSRGWQKERNELKEIYLIFSDVNQFKSNKAFDVIFVFRSLYNNFSLTTRVKSETYNQNNTGEIIRF